MSRRCVVHGTLLERTRWDGSKFQHPVCFECVPAHREHCPQLDHVMLASTFYAANIRKDSHHYDLADVRFPSIPRTMRSILGAADRAFDAEFGDDVPPCECHDRLRALGLRDEKPSKKPSATCVICTGNGSTVGTMTWRETRVALAPYLAEVMPAGLERLQTVPHGQFALSVHPACLQKAVRSQMATRAEALSPV